MNYYTFVAPCHFGLESVLSGELKRMGAENVSAIDGRVSFTGDLHLMARANLNLRTAERVLIQLGDLRPNHLRSFLTGFVRCPWKSLSGGVMLSL